MKLNKELTCGAGAMAQCLKRPLQKCGGRVWILCKGRVGVLAPFQPQKVELGSLELASKTSHIGKVWV